VPLTRFGEIVYYQSTSLCQCDAREFSISWVLLLAHRVASCDRRPQYAILIAEPPSAVRKAPIGSGDMRSNVRNRVRHALPIACGLTAFGPGSSQYAFAQTIPSYATSVHCQRVAGFGGAFSRSIYGSCLNVEQSAALALQSRWSSISASVRERCERIANFGGSGSYSILQNCVDVELAAPASSGPPAAGGIARFYLVTSEGGQGTSYNTLADCLEARAKATQTAICINR
jgi:hypothetical protein